MRAYRKKLGILPAVKRINTVASEHPDLTNYLYMTYSAEGYDVNYYKNENRLWYSALVLIASVARWNLTGAL